MIDQNLQNIELFNQNQEPEQIELSNSLDMGNDG